MIELDHGYFLMKVLKHNPILKITETDKKKIIKYKNLLILIKFIDDKLSNYFEKGDGETLFYQNKKAIEKNHTSSEYFTEYLESVFALTQYEKRGKKARRYSFHPYFDLIIQSVLKFIIEEKNNKEKLFKPITLENNYILKKTFPDLYFKNSIFYFDFYADSSLYTDIEYTKTNGYKKIDLLNEMNSYLTSKDDIEYFYNIEKEKYKKLEATDEIVLDFDFCTSRKKIENTKTKEQLKSFLHTKIEIDGNRIKELIDIFLLNGNKYLNIFPLIKVFNHYSNNNNYLLYEKKNFRYYPINELNHGINLQSMKKKYRAIFFENQFDYDIEAGAPTLLVQYIKKLYPNKQLKLKYVDNYIKDRNIIRNRSVEIFKDYSDNFNPKKDYKKLVKETINASLYGADLYNRDSEIEMSFDDRTFLLDRYPGFFQLIEHIKNLNQYYRDYIKEQFKQKKEFIKVINDDIPLYEYKDGKKNKRKTNEIQTSIYFSLESQVLKVIYSKYKDSLSLMIHDGFISRVDIDINDLSKLIKDKLDFDVKYERGIIKFDINEI